MNNTTTTSRRLLLLASGIVAVIFGLWCLIWYVGGPLSNSEQIYPFLGVAVVHLVTAVTFFITARTRWRWVTLLITLPCAFGFLDRSLLLWKFAQG